MISSLNYSKKKVNQTFSSERKQQFSERQFNSVAESVLSQRQKIKARGEREKPARVEHLRTLSGVKMNQVIKDPSQKEQSSAYSQNDKDRDNIGAKEYEQYFQKVKANGFSEFPPPITQIIPPILMTSMVIEIILVSLSCMEHSQIYIILGAIGILLIPISYFWYKTTEISPTDSIQVQHLDFIKYPQTSSFQPEKHNYICNLCKTCISQRSFHCNRCNRCVDYFDHHCKWINNCIGAKNYFQFIQLLVWSQLFMILFFICNAIFICKIVNANHQMPQILWYSVVMLVLAIIPFIALSMLLFLHLYLVIAKRSTIELILQSRRKNKIYPQNQNDFIQKKNEIVSHLPQQSPINFPNIMMQNSILRDMNEQNNQKLKRFMENLRNNLKPTKTDPNRKTSCLQYIETEKKFNFKPTILKKNNRQLKENFKSNTVRINRVQIDLKRSKIQQSNQNQRNNLDNFTSDSSQVEQTSTNLVTKLKFSKKQQKVQQQFQTKTGRQSSLDIQKYHTERAKSQRKKQRKQRQPKKLEPINKLHIERKIKFKSKTQTMGKQLRQKTPQIQLQNIKESQIQNLKDKDADKVIPVEKIDNTRYSKVVSSKKEEQEQK